MDSWKSLRPKLSAARTLSWPDRWLLLQAWVLLLVVDVSLRLLPFRSVQKLLAARRQNAVPPDPAAGERVIARHQRLVDVAARHHLYAMSCLRQSLVLQRLLARRGIYSDLRFGVHKDGAELAAHAWLEYLGQPIAQLPATVAQFVPLKASR